MYYERKLQDLGFVIGGGSSVTVCMLERLRTQYY